MDDRQLVCGKLHKIAEDLEEMEKVIKTVAKAFEERLRRQLILDAIPER